MIRWVLTILYVIFLIFICLPVLSDSISQCSKTDDPIDIGILLFLITIHVLAGIGIWMIKRPKVLSIAYTIFLSFWFAISVTAGLHRLYTHQTYKAHPIMDVFYNIGVLLCMSVSTDSWVRTHKIHHRYSDTCADPHYADQNTFFYSHFGWIYRKRTPEEEELISKEDLHHLDQNPFIVFQKKYYGVLLLITQSILFLLPLLWGDFTNCFWLSMIRLVYCLNSEFSVNSFAHMYGNRPYDPNIRPTENVFVSIATNGEGYHNYHHLFPKDFRASDSFTDWNPTTQFILFLHRCRLASDLKYFCKTDQQWKIIP